MNDPGTIRDPEAVEIRLLLEGLFQEYGFDFRNYVYGPVRRRIRRVVRAEGAVGVSELQARLLRDPECAQRLVVALTERPGAVFGEPAFYAAFRRLVVPVLRTHPSVRIWNVDCAGGEEAHSLAVLLAEEGLGGRTRIYATDVSERLIAQARTGSLPGFDPIRGSADYRDAGGRRELSDFLIVDGGRAALRPELRSGIVFAQHNPVTDSSFNDFHVVVCRNTLPRCDRYLAERVRKLLYDSLVTFGVLCVDRRGSRGLSDLSARCEVLDAGEGIHRMVR